MSLWRRRRPAREKLLFAEEVLVDLHDLNAPSHLHTNTVFDHQLGELHSIDQGDILRNTLGCIRRLCAESARGEEHPHGRPASGQRTHERLHGWAPDNDVFGVSLGLNIDLADAQLVAVDLAVETAVTRPRSRRLRQSRKLAHRAMTHLRQK